MYVSVPHLAFLISFWQPFNRTETEQKAKQRIVSVSETPKRIQYFDWKYFIISV